MSFQGFLRADTSVNVVIGPVVSVSDGYTPVTTLTLSGADEAELLKHNAGTTTDISSGTLTAITGADGYYNLSINSAWVDTEGMLTILINDDSLCLPVRSSFMVVNAVVYDALYAADGTDYLKTDVTQILGGGQSASDLKDFADTGYDPATHKVQNVVLVDTTTTNSDMRGTDNAALASVCTETRLAELDAGNIPSDIDEMKGTDGKCVISVDAQDLSGSLDVNTKTMTDGVIANATFNSDVGTTAYLSNTIALAVMKALEEIKLDKLIAAAESGDVIDNSVIAKMVCKSVTAAFSSYDNTTDSLEAIRDNGDANWSSTATNPNVLLSTGIATVTSQTEFTLDSGSDDDDAYKGQTVVMYDNTNSDYPSVRVITDYIGATRTITLDSAPDFTLADDDTVKIFVTAPGTTAPTAAEVADAVWDEQASGHTDSGSFAKYVAKVSENYITDGGYCD